MMLAVRAFSLSENRPGEVLAGRQSLRRAKSEARVRAKALLELDEPIQRHDVDVKLRNRARTVTARSTCGP